MLIELRKQNGTAKCAPVNLGLIAKLTLSKSIVL